MAAQTPVFDAPMQFGYVGPDDLAMTVYEQDATADAVVLGDFGVARVHIYSDGAKLRSDRHRRIKVLKRSGFDYGDVAIPFYSYKKQESFYFIRAAVHLPNGKKIELTRDDVFIEKMNQYYSQARFTFPNMVEGCVIEYAYSIHSESIYELADWFFQEEIPVRHSELQVEFPDRFAYTYLFQGNEGMLKTKETEDGEITFTGQNGIITLGDRRYTMRNAPAMLPEAYITTMDDYRARIRFQLAEIRYQDGRKVKVMDTWDNLQDELDHHAYFGLQYLKKSHHKKMLEEVLPKAKGLSTEGEKAQFFYDYLLQNLSWNGRYSMATRTEKLDHIFETRQGTSGELNLMLLVLLREAGIEAWPLITSTRSNGKMYENYPLIDQFNHTMVVAELEQGRTFLDVTDPLRPPGFPCVQALNGRGVLLKEKCTPEWVDITPPKNGRDIFIFELTLNEDGTLTGEASCAYNGYNAIPERRRYISDKTGAHWEKRLAAKFPDVSLASVRIGNLWEVEEAFFDTLELSIPGAAQVAGDFIYLSPVLHTQFDENPFKRQERLYPVNIPYPFTEQYILKLNLPEGYQVEELPKNARVSLPDGGGSFHFVAQESKPGEIQVTSSLTIKKLNYGPMEYTAVKELFDLMVEKIGEQIVLKRK